MDDGDRDNREQRQRQGQRQGQRQRQKGRRRHRVPYELVVEVVLEFLCEIKEIHRHNLSDNVQPDAAMEDVLCGEDVGVTAQHG
jgi:hypothetical protein